jgi:NAD(P)-dependent dehydrogenase (short-subunit alcohol dehydrogenase family)
MSGATTVVLILGGYGNFGARIARALVDEPNATIVIAGRDAGRAERFAQTLLTESPAAKVRGIALDIGAADFSTHLRTLDVGVVIHTAGPFQEQGYGVALAAAEAGVPYIDLADGRRFVCDFAAAVDARARASKVASVTGASTLPALSSAVVDALTSDWRSIESIESCIAPAQTAPRGRATLEGVLAYCGEAVRVWRQSRWTVQPGWGGMTLVTFARLRPRLGAVCDVPDLELFVDRYAGVATVMFRAALEVGLGQRALSALSTLRFARVLPSLPRFAGALDTIGKLFDPLGSALGGMVVRVRGIDAGGKPAACAWHVTAPDGHGPEIPCMAAILLARRILRGESLPIGATPCMGLLALTDFDDEFVRWGMMVDRVDEELPHAAPEV